MERMGVEVVAVSPERAVLIMPLAGNLQTAGVLHGGASAALAETAASLAAAEHARRVSGASARAVGVELSISHLRPGTGGRVTATARALHLGRTSTVHLVDITDEEGRLISSARVSNRVVAAPPS
ncbi:MAG: hotdog fold thioesterase [Actinomyces sp.]|jgi:uncharacterized protein (TIGR00369 family)|nr:hotdog fold thioesterase [Actinomyces sp.]MCI1641999.1 hotdog fold thioesterase [Actinomyces sp.]MCI1662997.1 hotdog fold thioesterase [Actinomyces sp.]MCI1691591.1 hotdog fold thioesterase [Actinomyces sp.]MCI1788270.1 hotdog fold thioesterase [Actinomyces sp.]MCI1830610.1 hotdog fold thioesterase [Actinomyces sp.]